MPPVDCPHCGETAFILNGWMAAHHCPCCGRQLWRRDSSAALVRASSRALMESKRISRNPPRPRAPTGR